MRMMLLGAPGAGKGTQAQQLAGEIGIPQISTGDMLREAKASGTEMGKRVADVMARGELVTDEIVIGLIREKLEGDKKGGFIFDGFPRTLAQADALGEWLAEKGAVFDRVLCSTAVRTRETAEYARLQVTHFLDAIYEASVGELVRLLESHSDAEHLALVGHNPGIAGVAGFLTGTRQIMTPGTIVGIAFEPEVQGSVPPQCGRMRLYHPPAR